MKHLDLRDAIVATLISQFDSGRRIDSVGRLASVLDGLVDPAFSFEELVIHLANLIGCHIEGE